MPRITPRPLRSRIGAALVFALVACGGASAGDPDYIDVRDGQPPGSARQPPAPAADAGGAGAGDDADTPGVDVAACPDTGRGPKMIRIQPATGSAFCVDATEVTKLQYQAFLGDTQGKVVTQPAACAWNKTFLPQYDWPPTGREQHPANNVDWCDARAFCEWAGKRLCDESQWASACSGPSGHVFPYGDTFEPATCTGCMAQGSCGRLVYNNTTPVASKPGCVSSPGLVDMSGNVEEWVDACTPDGTADGNDDLCVTRGGGFPDDGDKLACKASLKRRRDAIQGETGIRCCASVEP